VRWPGRGLAQSINSIETGNSFEMMSLTGVPVVALSPVPVYFFAEIALHRAAEPAAVLLR
jgi:hypothetical protein